MYGKGKQRSPVEVTVLNGWIVGIHSYASQPYVIPYVVKKKKECKEYEYLWCVIINCVGLQTVELVWLILTIII